MTGVPLSAHPAERVVSLNLCTDQMLVLLAPEKVAALTPLARDPALSFVAREAARLPIVRASAEAVLRVHPDLVLAGPYGAQTTFALLEREGVPVLRVPLPHDFDGVRAETRRLAAALGVPQRGEALIAAMDARLAGAGRLAHMARPAAPRRALAWVPLGLTAGPGTLMDAVLLAAGLTNVARGQHIGLEALVRLARDVVVLPTEPIFPSLATELLDHPALAGIERQTVPQELTIGDGPFTGQAAVLLAR